MRAVLSSDAVMGETGFHKEVPLINLSTTLIHPSAVSHRHYGWEDRLGAVLALLTKYEGSPHESNNQSFAVRACGSRWYFGLFINDNLSSTQQSSPMTQADARVGNPLTPVSVAGVARRQTRRAVRRGAVVTGAAVGAGGVVGAGVYAPGAYYGTPGAYYGVPGGGYSTAAEVAPPGAAAVVAPAPYAGPGYGYGPGPEPGSVIVNPVTGRWCRTEPSGWQWCWTP